MDTMDETKTTFLFKSVPIEMKTLTWVLVHFFIIHTLLPLVAMPIVADYLYGPFTLEEYYHFFIIYFFISLIGVVLYGIVFTILIYTFKRLSVSKYLTMFIMFGGTLFSFILILAHLGLFIEYGEGINNRLLFLFQGEGMALMRSIWNIYPMNTILISLILISAALPLLTKKLHSFLNKRLSDRIKKISIFSFILSLIVGSILSGFKVSEVKGKIETLSIDHNLSFIRMLLGTNSKRLEEKYLRGVFGDSSDKNHRDVLAFLDVDFFVEKPSLSFPQTVGDSQAPFQLIKKPTQIFFIQMEGQESSTLEILELEQLTPNLNRYKNEGIYVPYFFPTGDGTNSSTLASLSGFSGSRNDIPKFHTMVVETELSLIPQLYELEGYSSSVHSASHYKSCHHGAMLEQIKDCDLIFYSDQVAEKSWQTPWGINDEQFVNSILENTVFPNHHFAFFMTLSNHVPYNLDVYNEGFTNDLLPKHLEYIYEKGGESSQQKAGHIWYSDFHTGRLIESLYSKYPDSLFIITGDHRPSHDNIHKDMITANYTLPLIIWGPNVIPENQLGVKKDWYGSHSNLASSIIELVSTKKGSQYHSMGKPLWDLNKNIYGEYWVGDSEIFVSNNSPGEAFYYRTGKTVQKDAKIRRLIQWQNAMKYIAHKLRFNRNKW